MNKDKIYQEFLKENPENGILKVQVFMADQAIPIANVNILIEKEVSNETLDFYDGKTDESGVIENITLPAPKIDDNDIPKYVSYQLIVKHPNYQGPTTYTIPIYSGQKMLQYVVLKPLSKENANG